MLTRSIPGILRSFPFPAERWTLHELGYPWLGVLVNVDGYDQVGILGQFCEMIPLNLKVINLDLCKLDHGLDLLWVGFSHVGTKIGSDAGEDEC